MLVGGGGLAPVTISASGGYSKVRRFWSMTALLLQLSRTE